MGVEVVKFYKVSIPVYTYIKSITKGLSKADYKLFCHLLTSTVMHFRQTQENSRGWLSIPRRFIRAKFRNAVPKHLEANGLIYIDKQYFPGKRSRHYRITDWVIDGYVAEASRTIANREEEWVNLITGKPLPFLPTRFIEDTPSGIDAPALIDHAIKCFSACYYSRVGVLKHLSMLKAEYQKDPTTAKRFRYLNDYLCFDTADKFACPIPNSHDIYYFKPSYTVQTTGRISTALQSCSRAMKHAAYAPIPNVFNYDLASSQITLTLAEMKKCDIACPWLEDYLADKTKRGEYASYIGISEDTWKSCLCTVLMGGLLPTTVKWGDKTSIVRILREELEVSGVAAVEFALSRLREVLKPLIRPLKLWHKRVTEEVAISGYIINPVGLRREYQDFKSPKTSGIVAHILQGTEAYFIHTLTTISDKYGFKPLGNEHDGLITLGRIPHEAIDEVKCLTGLFFLELREKPFTV